MNNKVSVITVVFNDVAHIRETIESFFSQTWENKEYIVIDGGSNDGTAEIVKQYADQLSYWCSEKDNGIYDAMNKGVKRCTGDWINILNSGDLFATPHALEDAMTLIDHKDADVIYGNSIEIYKGAKRAVIAEDKVSFMEYHPIYRHGASFVKRTLHQDFLFNTKRKDLGFALDWEQIHRIYKAGYKFQKTEAFIQVYDREGASNHAVKSLWYNYKITSMGHFCLNHALFLAKKTTKTLLSQTTFYRWAHAFFMEYVINDILPHIPFWIIRRGILRKGKMRIGKKSFIMKRAYFMSANHIQIGNYTNINQGCLIDGRGGIVIGDNVSISHAVKIVTGGHDVQSAQFDAIYLPVVIKDFVWLGCGCTILQGVTIGKGAVVCAGAVVTHDVEEYTIVAGIPAKKINKRNKKLDYHCIWESPFT